MTKREMVEEMIKGLNYPNNERVIKRCCDVNTHARVKEVYDYFKTHEEEQHFCILVLER